MNEALELIHQYTPVGGLVVDMCAGTMVSALAALRLNRHIICVEIDKKCMDLAISRAHRFYRFLKMNNLLLPRGNHTPLC